jgi:hypothetical protein
MLLQICVGLAGLGGKRKKEKELLKGLFDS